MTEKKTNSRENDESLKAVLSDDLEFHNLDQDSGSYFFKQHILVLDFSRLTIAFSLFAKYRNEYRWLNAGHLNKAEVENDIPEHYIRKCLNALSIKYNLRNIKILIITNGLDFFLRRVQTPPLSGEALKKAIIWNSAKQIPYPIEEAYLNILNVEKSKSGNKALIAVTRKNLVDRFSFLGDKLLGVIPSPIALIGNFVRTSAVVDSDNVIIYWGTNEGFIDYLNNGKLEFSHCFKLIPHIAEGTGTSLDILAEKIENNLKNSIDFYSTVYPGQRIENIKLYGAQSHFIAQQLSKSIDINIDSKNIFETQFDDNDIIKSFIADSGNKYFLQLASINLPRKYLFLPSTISNLYKFIFLKSITIKASAIISLIILLLAAGFLIEKNYKQNQISQLNNKIETIEKSEAYKKAGQLREDLAILTNSISELELSAGWSGEILRGASFSFPADIHLTHFAITIPDDGIMVKKIRIEGYYQGDTRKADITIADMIEDLNLHCGVSVDRLDRIAESVGKTEKNIKFVLTGSIGGRK